MKLNFKNHKLLKKLHKKSNLVKIVLLVILVGLLGLTGWILVESKNSLKDISTGNDPATTSKKAETVKPEDQPAAPPTTQPGSPKANNTPFFVSKVYFAEAPQRPAEAQSDQCHIGQLIGYDVRVQVTASNKGRAYFHWEIADHQGGTVEKQNTITHDFAKAGTETLGTTLFYTVRDVGHGDNYSNRQFINLVITTPNEMYANFDQPVYAYRNSDGPFFIWGTYIDLC